MDYFSRISFRKQANSRIVLKYKKKYICVFLINCTILYYIITDIWEKSVFHFFKFRKVERFIFTIRFYERREKKISKIFATLQTDGN